MLEKAEMSKVLNTTQFSKLEIKEILKYVDFVFVFVRGVWQFYKI